MRIEFKEGTEDYIKKNAEGAIRRWMRTYKGDKTEIRLELTCAFACERIVATIYVNED